MEDNSEKKAIDKIRDVNNKQKEMKNKVKKAKLIIRAMPFLFKAVVILCIFITMFSLTVDIWGMIKSSTTPTVIYKTLEVEDLAELVKIDGNSNTGYYLTFKDDAEEKISKTVDQLTRTSGAESEISKELLKKIIKAQVITQFPDLGGQIKSGTDGFQGAVKIRRVSPDKDYGEMKNTSDGEETKEDVAYGATGSEGSEESNKYTIGIMASYSTDSPGGRSPNPKSGETQLKEEEMTIKVANYIEQALSIYSNINVMEIGSTKSNPNVSNDGRLQKAKDANVDALIGIEFNSAGDGNDYTNDNGVTISYNQDGGSENSKKLGNILKETVSSKMSLVSMVDNQTDISNTLGTKEEKFPSVIIKGGYLTSKKDYSVLSTENGLQNYAKGVVDGILKYFNIENKGYGTIIQGTNSISNTVNSKVIDLKYVPISDFEKHIEDNSKQALKEFSLDENNKVVTATWSYEDGNISISKNSSSVDYKSVINKYTMPIEYLINWYIYTKEEKFVSNLAKLALDSSYILMLEDNVTTTQVNTVTSEYVEEFKKDDNGEYSILTNNPNWKDVDSTQKFSEKVSSKMELIYVDTWFMRFSNNLLIDQESNKVQKANGTVTSTDSESESEDVETEEWTDKVKVSKVSMKAKKLKSLLVPGGTDDDQYDGLYEESESSGNDGESNDESSSSSSNGDSQYEGLEEENNSSEENEEKTEYYKRNTTTKVVTKTKNIVNQYKAGESEVTGDEKKFINIFKENEETKYVLQYDWLIRALEDNEKTANMVDLTKYLIYKASGEDTGVITFDFSEYAPKSFNTSTGIYGGTIQEKVWFALRDLGYSEISVAGAMGNIHWESGGFNPSLIEGGSGEGIGLIQWSFGRKEGLINYANSKGVSWQDEDTQIEYLVTEITGEGKAVGYATYQFMNAHGYSADDWENASDIKTATEAFCWCFERPNAEKAHVAEREQFANEYYADFQGKTKPSGSSTSAEGDGYTQIYTASSGKQYREYKQYEGSYKDTLYMPYGEPISSIGCSLTAIAISLTGYGVDVNPGDLAGHNYLSQHFEDYGVSCSRGSATADNITDHLNEGKPVVVEISGTLVTAEGTKYYGQHFIALIDINSDGDVYVSDPGSTVSNGWAKVNDIVNISKSALYAEN